MALVDTLAFPQGTSNIWFSTFSVNASPMGAVIFVCSATSRGDARSRLKFFGSAAVSPTQGSQQGPVGDPQDPLATVFGAAGALSFCKAGRGDLIVVLGNHVENLSNNAAYSIPNGVSIVGLDYGPKRPTFTYTGGTLTTISCLGSAMINNCIFNLTGVAGVVSGFTLTVGGVQIIGCRIVQSGAANKATSAVTLNAGADDFVFSGCDLDATGAAGQVTNGIITGATVNRPELVNNFFHGNWSAGAIVAANANPMLGLVIQNNEVYNSNTGAAQAAMTLGSASSGTVAFNNFFIGGTTTGVGSSIVGTPTSTLIIWNQNFGYNNIANKGGNLIPAAGAALT